MTESIHYLLLVDHLMIQQLLFRAIRETGLTMGQPKVLDFLIDHDGAVQKEIAAACHIAPPSLTSVLGGMEQKGLITRIAPDNNRRSLRVFLTDYGREMAHRVTNTFTAIEDVAMKDFTPEEQKQFHDLLFRLHQNLLAAG